MFFLPQVYFLFYRVSNKKKKPSRKLHRDNEMLTKTTSEVPLFFSDLAPTVINITPFASTAAAPYNFWKPFKTFGNFIVLYSIRPIVPVAKMVQPLTNDIIPSISFTTKRRKYAPYFYVSSLASNSTHGGQLPGYLSHHPRFLAIFQLQLEVVDCA